MRDLALLFVHLLATIARLFGPGGAQSVIAESALVKHQLLVLNRSRTRAPRLRPMDRVIVGLCAIWIRPARLLRSAIVLKPSTILKFHRALVRQKYHLLFTPKTRGKTGPKGPSAELISMIVEMKRRNPSFGYQRIADQISLVFDIEIDKDTVRRVLARHYKPEPGSNGPSWLTFLGHSKDSLWSVDLFRCESLTLKSHWVMVVMDQFTCGVRIVIFRTNGADVQVLSGMMFWLRWPVMRDLATLFVHLLVTIARLFGPGGARSVVAESLFVKHQLLILNRSRARAPSLRPMDRIIAGLCAIPMRPARLVRSSVVLKPSTVLSFHRALVKRKYRLLFTPKTRGKPGPKGPSAELISMIVEMKCRNPNFGYQRIADQISLVFDVEIDKDIVRRVLARHYKPEPGSDGPSWLSFLGHSKDSLSSVDLFRCESLTLKSHWVMVVMDQFTRRIVGFAVHAGAPDGPGVCHMFNSIISGAESPQYLSSDNDPLFRFRRWDANLRILEVTQVKTVPYVPLSHPFVERLIGTIRREYLDQAPFWTALDLERKLRLYKEYYNKARPHQGLDGALPDTQCDRVERKRPRLDTFQWRDHCRGLYQLPEAA